MALKKRLSVIRVEDEAGRAQALEVLRAIYRDEKDWVRDEISQFPHSDLAEVSISWFVVRVDTKPVGVLRVLYDLPLHLYREYGFKLLNDEIDVEAFCRQHQIAEIGRFAVLPQYRKHIVVVISLMRAAILDTVKRGYTHYISDVFEDELHSPYQLLTRVMGFQPAATHDVGELNCRSRRITLILDIKAAYQRLQPQGGFVYRFLTEGWDEKLHQRLTF
ncbi:MAG TPA: hypothetical protein V6D03_15250 [Candidatus Caenarcaniphilales bacterium]